MSNQLLSRSCFLLAMILALVWGYADSLHNLKHPEGRSRLSLVQSVIFLISSTLGILVMIVLACFGRLTPFLP
jgi:hypothetical protein